MTHIITTPKCLLVEVPEGSNCFEVHDDPTDPWLDYYDPEFAAVDLPPASYGDPVLAAKMTEEQWFQVVDSYEALPNAFLYCNYEVRKPIPVTMLKDSAIESGQSLLRAHSLKPETTIVIPIN